MALSEDATARLQRLRDCAAKGALSMIDYANNKPDNRGKKPKVGGHQASSMSSVDLLCALYLHTLRPEDRLAVKPHAAPVVYALMHLMGLLSTEAMGALREKGGPQPYPTKLKAPLFVDYTTSSEALGVCATIYDAYATRLSQVQHKTTVDPRYFAHCGDGELTEGQIDESLYDAGRWGLTNLVWIVDLNRQSLDRVMDDSGRLEAWVEAKFRGHGWHVLRLRWGARALELFARPGGAALQAVLDRMPDHVFHPLLMVDGSVARQALLGQTEHETASKTSFLKYFAEHFDADAAERAEIARCVDGIDGPALREALHHLGGHDIPALIEAFDEAIAFEGGPVVIVAHTVKGYQTSAAAHPENHGMLLSSEEVAAWGESRGVPRQPYPLAGEDAAWIADRGAHLFDRQSHRWVGAPTPVSDAIGAVRAPRRSVSSSGEAFQSINMALLRGAASRWLHFGAPDVGQTTHLGPVIKATGVFAPRPLPDPFAWLREEKGALFDWRPAEQGQFHCLGIAEGNAMLWAYSMGRRVKHVEGRQPFLPVVTVYDKFFERGFNQLDYAVYNNGRFVAVGVPSGTGLSREAATHQSLQTLRMMMDLPGLLSYEPAFAADVHAVYLRALAQLWDEDGEAVYLRLSTQPLAQPTSLPDDHADAAWRGGYWLVGEDDRRGDGVPVILVASGRKVADAQRAGAILASEHGIGSRILNVTSYEALWRDWDAWTSSPDRWESSYWLHELFEDAEVNAPMVLIGDHVPSVCEWLPGALHRVRPYRVLAPRRNGESGSLDAIDRLHGMGVEDIVEAALLEVRWRQRIGVGG